MKILIIDRDRLSAQMIKTKLETPGHEVVAEPSKNEALELMKETKFDVILFDPAPLKETRSFIISIRRFAGELPLLYLMAHDMSVDEAIRNGMNDLLSKPVDVGELDTKIRNAESMLEMKRYYGDDSIDFPSAGGVIAKSAFNQLFLSCLDRAVRYGEKAFIIRFSLKDDSRTAENVDAIQEHLVRLRRQSDLISKTAEFEYALLLLRPIYEAEPLEATKRFTESLQKFENMHVSIDLIELPTGNFAAHYDT